ncbi:MAG: glycosyltransferase, partial [Prevotellaceae bacterium]|nr:glycosyltransferase [Prevotellaceae bacterium]
VFAQAYPNIEYVIIDGGSTDRTLEIVKHCALQITKKFPLRWISEQDNGIYDAMNKGIALAKGELIGILNADDFYEADAVEAAVKAFSENSQAGIFYGNVNLLNPDGTFFKVKKSNPNLSELYKGFSLQHPTFFVTAETYKNHGKFDANFKIAGDYDFSLRCYLVGVEFCYIDKVLTNFRQGGASRNKFSNIVEGKRVLLKNGYTENLAPIIRQWKKAAALASIYSSAYLLAKKIIPLSVLNKIANSISISKK